MFVNLTYPPQTSGYSLVHCGISNAGNDKGVKTYNIFQLGLKGYFLKHKSF